MRQDDDTSDDTSDDVIVCGDCVVPHDAIVVMFECLASGVAFEVTPDGCQLLIRPPNGLKLLTDDQRSRLIRWRRHLLEIVRQAEMLH